MKKHTQGKWNVFAITVDDKPKNFAIGCKEATIAICKRINVSDEEAEANAEHIVKCVNMHDKLIAVITRYLMHLVIGIRV